jgi:hypothetical protein
VILPVKTKPWITKQVAKAKVNPTIVIPPLKTKLWHPSPPPTLRLNPVIQIPPVVLQKV